jgi:uncharacterized membrane protein (UPF0127 family)
VLGVEVPVASGPVSRLLGLAWLPREKAGPGLLLPRCRSVHTFGMRFPLDLFFLDAELRPLAAFRSVAPGRVISLGAASAVLEVPACGPALQAEVPAGVSPAGGESAAKIT